MTFVVIGARGSIGGAVLSGLLAAGQPVRASSRNPRPGDFPAGVEVAQADLGDPQTFPALLDGARKVFLYADSGAPAEFAAQARKAGVAHIVFLSSNSVLFPDASDNPIAAMHMEVEQALRESGVDWTFVRPGYLATNTYRWQASIRAERTVRTAFPEGGAPLVHERDVAEVAVRALLDDACRGQAYLVPGGAVLTEREQVGDIAAALGEPVRLDVLSVDDYRAELAGRVPDVFIERIIGVAGQVPQVPEDVRIDAVPQLLGRPPLTFAQWARDHVADFR